MRAAPAAASAAAEAVAAEAAAEAAAATDSEAKHRGLREKRGPFFHGGKYFWEMGGKGVAKAGSARYNTETHRESVRTL